MVFVVATASIPSGERNWYPMARPQTEVYSMPRVGYFTEVHPAETALAHILLGLVSVLRFDGQCPLE